MSHFNGGKLRETLVRAQDCIAKISTLLNLFDSGPSIQVNKHLTAALKCSSHAHAGPSRIEA